MYLSFIFNNIDRFIILDEYKLVQLVYISIA